MILKIYVWSIQKVIIEPRFKKNYLKLWFGILNTFAFIKQSVSISLIITVQVSLITQAKNPKCIKKFEGLKTFKTIEVCKSQDVSSTSPYMVKIQDGQGNQHLVAIVRYKGGLYAVLGTCSYEDIVQELIETNFEQKQPQRPKLNKNSFENAILFNDKMYCPHHGCAFDIQTGSVEYGPALYNLPRFRVQEKEGKVILQHPLTIPKRIIPKVETQNQSDYRRVTIVGGDGPAVVGCIDGLRQYGFTGKVTVVQEEPQYPYQKHNIHKLIPNFREKLAIKPKKIIANKKQRAVLKQIDKQIHQLLQQKIYKKIKYRTQQWYKQLGINFIFTDDGFRVIGKRVYPYLSFEKGLKVEYDGLLVASDVKYLYPVFQGLNSSKQRPPNVFIPYRNPQEHQKLVKFLNLYDVRSMAVFGLNQQVLQFCQAVTTSFPDIKISVLDSNQISPISEHYGPNLMKAITNEFMKHNVQFYIKIKTFQSLNNRMEQFLIDKALYVDSQPKKSRNIQDSIQITFPDGFTIKSDCAVLFSNNFQGKTQGIKKGKHTDVDFNKMHKIVTDSHCRSTSRRIFGAGCCSSMQFFFTKTRLQTNNPLVAYEQGLASAFNLMALNVPFHYIPFQRRKFFDKTLFIAGQPGQQVSNILIYGDVENWDFLCVYAKQNQVIGVSASPSKQRQFNTMRQAFRLECQPQFDDLISGKWKVKNLEKLIRKLNKSGCYRDPVHNLEQTPNLGDLVWVERNKGGYQNDQPLKDSQDLKEVDQRGYVRQL